MTQSSGTSEPAARKKTGFEMEFRDVPWANILLWLSNVTGQPVVTSNAKPTGTLTFIPPQVNGMPKRYTIPEIIDILNHELLKQKLILLRCANTFSVEPADEVIDPAILTRVLPSELEKYGDTELVSTVFSLNVLVAEDVANEVKGMLGPFGKAQALKFANKVVVQDAVGNLKRICAIIKESEDTQMHSRERGEQGQRREESPLRSRVEEKLNQILNRLDRIEKRLDGLERSTRSRGTSPGPIGIKE
jgi:hypothetical protein